MAGVVAAFVLVFSLAGGANAAENGEAETGGLVSSFPGFSAFASPDLLVRDHEITFGSFSGESPQALTVDQATGDLYVIDPAEGKLWRYTASGSPDDFTAGPDAGTNALAGQSFQSFPSYDEVAVDDSTGLAKGDIYVTNSAGGHVKVFASSGEPLGSLTGSGTPAGSLGESCGVAVDQATGDLYVAARGNRIWRYAPSSGVVSETDYSGGIEIGIEPCQIAVANGNVYAKAWQEFPVEGAGPVDSYAISAFATGTPPLVSGTQVLARATGVSADPVTGDLYADERSKVTVYDPSGTTLYSYGVGEIGSSSTGVAVASGGASYVSDQNNHEVHLYGATLEPGSRANLGEFGPFGGEGPQAMTVDQATGDVYVVDPAGKELWRYSAGGAPVDFTAGPDAGSNALTGLGFQSFRSIDEVAVDDSSGPAKGDIYVTQNGAGGQVKVFSSSGQSLGTLTGSSTPAGSLGEACGIAVDQANGDLYIAARGSRIWRYTPSGSTVAETDYSGGIETGIEPCQIAVANGSIYAKAWQEFPVEGAGPLEKYATSAFATGTPPSPSAVQVATKVTAIATDPATSDLYADEGSKITVYDSSGATVYSFAAGEIGNFSAGVAIKTGGGDAYVADATSRKVRIYGPFSAPPPLLEAKPPSGVGHVKATMNAHLDPNNSLAIASCAFEWGTDTNYTETPIVCEQGNAYTTPADVSAALTGLTPGTTYHYRLHATTSNGSFQSQDQSFETTPASSTPEASTRKATVLSTTSTELKGAVDANANPLTGCHFEYVTDVAFAATGFSDLSSGGSLPCSPAFGSIPVDYEDHEVTATAIGLDPQQVYRYRLVAENSNGAGESEPALIPGPPLVETTGSPTRTTTTARFDSRVNPHGLNTDYWFEYVTDAQYQTSGFTNATSTPHELLAANDVQKVTVAPLPKFENREIHYSGQFTCSFGGYTTSALSGPVFASEFQKESLGPEFQSALSALPSIGAGNVHVDSLSSNGTLRYAVTFQGNLGNAEVKELACSSVPAQPVQQARVETIIEGGPIDRILLASAPVSGLQPGTTYHYRVVADNGTPNGTVDGTGQTLTTRGSEAPLSHGHHPGPPVSDRAWEQVSIPDTDGNAVQIPDISNNGERVVYGIDGGTPGSSYGGETFGRSNYQLAERSASGWRPRGLYPPRTQALGSIWLGPWGNAELTNLYAVNYDEANASDARIFRMSPDQPAQSLYTRSGGFIETEFIASEDGTQLIGLLRGTVEPSRPFGEGHSDLYDFSSGVPQLIDLLPDGSIPGCGVSPAHMISEGTTFYPAQNWITPDGSHVFFVTYPSVGACYESQLDLYDRDLRESKTTLVSPGGRFIRYTAGAVFFDTTESLLPSDHGGRDIYRYTVSSGAISCITCATAAAGDVESDVNNGGSDYGTIAVSDDGSHVYFTGPKRVLPGAASPGIYRINVMNGELAYVAPAYNTKTTEAPNLGGGLSPDGRFFVFRSEDMELNAVNGQQNAGAGQYYLYDDRDRSLICASCPPDGTAPRGEVPNNLIPSVSRSLHNDRAVADSGEFVFPTPTALVHSDQNTAGADKEPSRGEDIYEWRDGRLLLVTDGKTESYSTVPQLDGIAADGRDLFFTQASALTPDAIDSSRHLYDARVGGGFDFPSAPVPCSLEACQGTPLPPPGDATPASLSFSGPGNQLAANSQTKSCIGAKCSTKKSRSHKRCAKGKSRKRGKCVKMRGRHARKANHNKGGAK